jgi:hypothetical protein
MGHKGTTRQMEEMALMGQSWQTKIRTKIHDKLNEGED